MTITIENPTAEAIYEALQQLPSEELARLQQMFVRASYGENYRDYWTDEDIEYLRRSTHQLIEKRLGEEKYSYD